MNTMFGWPVTPSYDLPGGGPAYPLSAPAIRIRYRPINAVNILLGVFSGSPAPSSQGDPQRSNRSGVSFPFNRGELVFVEFQYSYPSLGGMVEPGEELPPGPHLPHRRLVRLRKIRRPPPRHQPHPRSPPPTATATPSATAAISPSTPSPTSRSGATAPPPTAPSASSAESWAPPSPTATSSTSASMAGSSITLPLPQPPRRHDRVRLRIRPRQPPRRRGRPRQRRLQPHRRHHQLLRHPQQRDLHRGNLPIPGPPLVAAPARPTICVQARRWPLQPQPDRTSTSRTS